MNKERRSGYCDKENQQQCERKPLPRIRVTLQNFPLCRNRTAATLILCLSPATRIPPYRRDS